MSNIEEKIKEFIDLDEALAKLKEEQKQLADTIKQIEQIRDAELAELSAAAPDGFECDVGRLVKTTRDVVNIIDIEALSQEYTRIKVEADKPAIKKAIKAGVEVKGAEVIDNHTYRVVPKEEPTPTTTVNYGV